LDKTLAPALPSSAATGVSIEPERLPVNPAPLVALPAASVNVPANCWTLAAQLALALLVVVAGVLIWKRPRPTSKLGHS
jgi:hypothetical protein